MLSEHFSKAEFQCPCCQMLSIAMPLVTTLEELRALVGKPLKITSAYRCPVHNAAVGGAPKSEHISGLAADVLVPTGVTLKAFYAMADSLFRFKNGGIGLYPAEGKSPAFIHVDVRGTRARWARVGGKYVGIESVLGNPAGGGKA
jgi:uncharacterized protein YcbK (DUF882 family)